MRPTPPPLSNLATSGDHRAWMALSLPTLTVVLGLQMLRTLLPLFIFVLRDRIGWEAYQVGLLAFAIFASGFLVGAIYRLLGSKRVLLLTAGGLGVARLAIQLWRGDPLGDLSFAIAGTILFILFLPTYLGHVRAQGPDATSHYGLAVLLGISLDTALFGAFGTYDMVWRDGGTALAVTLVLVALLLASLLTLPPSEGSRGEPQADDSRWQVLPWVAVGSLLFLQLMVFQNVARLAALADWEMPLAFVWVMLSNAAGLGAAVWMLAYWRQNRWPIAALIGAILVVTLSFNERNAAVAAITLMAGQVSTAVLVALIFSRLGMGDGASTMGRTAAAHGVSMVIMTALLFGYFLSFDLKVPYDNDLLPPLAGLLLGSLAVGAGLRLPAARLAGGMRWLPALVGSVLIVVPLGVLLMWDTPDTAPGDSYPVRVMTYNLHNGFSTAGALEMEAIARVIEAQDPDVVGLQEVSRGWAINGSMDMLEWLSQRLQMPYIYGPTTGPLWGNAILTRYPVLESQEVDLPPRNLQLLRGFVWARIDLGGGQELQVINTHYHHREKEGEIRVQQSQALLTFIEEKGASQVVVMGDLNARPHEQEIKMLKDAGLVDALEDLVPGYTSPSDGPEKRIDYILVSKDLEATEPLIPATTASDHLPVVVTVSEVGRDFP